MTFLASSVRSVLSSARKCDGLQSVDGELHIYSVIRSHIILSMGFISRFFSLFISTLFVFNWILTRDESACYSIRVNFVFLFLLRLHFSRRVRFLLIRRNKCHLRITGDEWLTCVPRAKNVESFAEERLICFQWFLSLSLCMTAFWPHQHHMQVFTSAII